MCGSKDDDHLGGRPRGPRPRDAWRKGDAPRGTSRRKWYEGQDRKQQFRSLLRRVFPRLA